MDSTALEGLAASKQCTNLEADSWIEGGAADDAGAVSAAWAGLEGNALQAVCVLELDTLRRRHIRQSRGEKSFCQRQSSERA